MSTLRPQFAPFPSRPHPGVGGDSMNCIQRFLRSAYLPLRQAPFSAADRLSFPKDCSSCWPQMVVTSGTRAINCTTQRHLLDIQRHLHDIHGFEREDCKFEKTSKLKPQALAFFISYTVWFILYVVYSVLVTFDDRLGEGINNLVIFSGDKTLLSIASIRSLASMVAIPFALSAVVCGALALSLLSLTHEALEKYSLRKQAQAKIE